MPWVIVNTGEGDKPWCVYREGADGKPEGTSWGSHRTHPDAEDHRLALDANESEMAALVAEMAPDGSFERLRQDLDKAVQAAAATLFGADSETFVRYVFAASLVVRVWYRNDEPGKLFAVDWARSADGALTVTNPREVEEVSIFRPVAEILAGSRPNGRSARVAEVKAASASWKVGAARDLKIVSRDSWDGDAAKGRIFAWAGFDGDDPDSAKARRAFLIYDAGSPDLKGSYKLPFADIVDGDLVAVDAGLRAAAGYLPKTDAPAAVLRRARAVLDAYFDKLNAGTSSGKAKEKEMAPATVAEMAAPEGSFEALRNALDQAVSEQRSLFNVPANGGLYVVWTFADQVVVTVWGPAGDTLYRADWSRNESGAIVLANVTKVEETVVIQAAEMDGRGDPFGGYVARLERELAGEPVAEMVRFDYVSEFRGQPPDIALAEGVDLAALTEGDPEPMFLTLPVGKVGAVSRSNLRWNEALTNSVVKQINDRRPGGMMGHIPDEKIDSAFPVPDVHWVGAARIGDEAWAKGYVIPGAVREYVRRQKATGGKIATSIFGPGARQRLKDGTSVMAAFTLDQLDLAPYVRAALPLSGEFEITRQMAGQVAQSESRIVPNTQTTEEIEMDRNQIIAEMTPADAGLLPDAVRQAVIAEYTAEHEAESRVAELTRERDAAQGRVSEMTTQVETLQGRVAEFERAAFDATVTSRIAEMTDWPATSDDAKARLNALRATLRARVVAEMAGAQDAGKLDAVLTQLWDGEFKPLAEMLRDTLAGPSALVPGKNNQPQTDETWRKNVADNAPAEKARLGL